MATTPPPQWKSDLRAASFRGVPFFVESSEREGGRRGVTHEFAQRDLPFGEDTGRMAKKFQVDLYVIGATYNKDRDKLIDALEAAGPGVLIHPYFGRQVVDCFGGYRVRETTKDGGMAVITQTFTEHGDELFPDVTADPGFQATVAANSAIASATNKFSSKFSIAGLSDSALGDATARVQGLSATLAKYQATIPGGTGAIASFAFAVRKLSSNAIGLLNTPAILAQNVQNNIALLVAAGTSVVGVYNALQKLFTYGSTDTSVAAITPSLIGQVANSYEFNALVKTLAVANAVLVSQDIPFASTGDAFITRQQMLDCTDDIMSNTDEPTYQALMDLRSSIVQSVPPPDQNLKSVGTVKNLVTLPSLVVAYNLYGAVDLEPDLVSRNHIQNPAFVPAGINLEVLENE